MGRHSGGPDGPFQHQPAGQYEAPGQKQPPRKRRNGRNVMLGIDGAIAVILGITFAALAIGASGPGAVTAVRYSSAQQVIAALDHGNLRCVGAQYSTPPVVSGATSEASCNFSASENPFIDVFPGTVTTAMVLRNSVSTGTEKIWSDVGPNWWVQTTRAYVKRVHKILGGRVVGGPRHPPSASQPAPAPATSAPAAQPPSVSSGACRKRFTRWIKGDVRYEIYSIEDSLTSFNQASSVYTAVTFLDVAAMGARLAGHWPIPAYADPGGYWQLYLGDIRQAARDAGTPPAAAAAGSVPETASADAQQMQSDLSSLISELKQTIHKNPFG